MNTLILISTWGGLTLLTACLTRQPTPTPEPHPTEPTESTREAAKSEQRLERVSAVVDVVPDAQALDVALELVAHGGAWVVVDIPTCGDVSDVSVDHIPKAAVALDGHAVAIAIPTDGQPHDIGLRYRTCALWERIAERDGRLHPVREHDAFVGADELVLTDEARWLGGLLGSDTRDVPRHIALRAPAPYRVYGSLGARPQRIGHHYVTNIDLPAGLLLTLLGAADYKTATFEHGGVNFELAVWPGDQALLEPLAAALVADLARVPALAAPASRAVNIVASSYGGGRTGHGAIGNVAIGVQLLRASEIGVYRSVIIHEIVHGWFGNIVPAGETSESLVTFVQLQSVRDPADAWELRWRWAAAAAEHAQDPAGTAVLLTLDHDIGRPAMLALLGAIIEHKAARWSDVIEVARTTLGAGHGDWLAARLNGDLPDPRLTDIVVTRRPDGSPRRVVANVVLSRGATPRPDAIEVGVVAHAAGRLKVISKKTVIGTLGATPVAFDLPAGAEALMIDPDFFVARAWAPNASWRAQGLVAPLRVCDAPNPPAIAPDGVTDIAARVVFDPFCETIGAIAKIGRGDAHDQSTATWTVADHAAFRRFDIFRIGSPGLYRNLAGIPLAGRLEGWSDADSVVSEQMPMRLFAAPNLLHTRVTRGEITFDIFARPADRYWSNRYAHMLNRAVASLESLGLTRAGTLRVVVSGEVEPSATAGWVTMPAAFLDDATVTLALVQATEPSSSLARALGAWRITELDGGGSELMARMHDFATGAESLFTHLTDPNVVRASQAYLGVTVNDVATLDMLAARIGREAVLALVADPATTWDALADRVLTAHGADARAFFDAWRTRTGLPQIALEVVPSSADATPSDVLTIVVTIRGPPLLSLELVADGDSTERVQSERPGERVVLRLPRPAGHVSVSVGVGSQWVADAPYLDLAD